MWGWRRRWSRRPYGESMVQRRLDSGCGPLLVEDEGTLIKAHGSFSSP